MMEVEYKAPVADLEAIGARLLQIGAEATGSETESDTYYAHPQRSFADTDEALRIRTTTAGHRLTYKGPRAAGPTRSRQELELRFDGPLAAILEALSFRVAGRVVKERRSFTVDGLTVTLDHVHGLGAFVEVEALVEGGDTGTGRAADLAQARDAVLGLVRRLGLGPEERRSYLELVLEQGTGSSGGAASPPP